MRRIDFARAMLLSSAITLAGIGSQAAAQETQVTEEATTPDTAEAEKQADAEVGTESITVTARRRDERLQDVPIAVSAYTGAQLEREGAIDITDVGDTTPNVTIENSRATNSTLTAFIRGIGQQDPVAGFEQGVGLYLDDVYLNRPQGAVLDIYDVDRIEILRGPQGTLYGRNTIGGAIKYVTKRLPDMPRLNVRATVGTYNQFDLVATASYPIADMLRVGGSIARLKRDGFGTNFTTGNDNYNKDVLAGRLSAEIGHDDSALLRLSADSTKDTSLPRGGYRLIPGLQSGTPVLDDVFDTAGGQRDPRQRVRNKGVAAHGQIRVTDWLKLKSITAFRKDKSVVPIDFDASPLVDVDVPGIYANKQLSQEFQAEINRGPLSGVVGAYYLDADAQTIFDVRLSTTFAGFTAFTDSDVNTKTWAVFGDFTYDINEHFAVSLGARYTDDQRKATVFRQSYVGGGAPIFGGLGIPFGGPTSNFSGERTDTAFTPRASISFKPNSDHHIYVSYSQGFKGGGFDPRGQSTQAPDLDGDGVDADDIYDYMTFEPEKVTSYELGWKGSLFDKRIYAGVALFHADYKDMQIPASVPCVVNRINSFCGLTSNAGKARIRGIEFEGNARVFGDPAGARLNFAWSLGYLDAKFKEFLTLLAVDENMAPLLGGLQPVDVADFRKIQNTPEWTASGTLNFTMPLAGGLLNLNSTLSYRSKSQQFEIASPMLDQKGFSLWNAAATYELPGGHWTVGLYGKNLTNKKYVSAGYNFLVQNPYTGQYIGNGVAPGSLGYNVPGFDAALGREGVLTAYYGNPRQIFFTLGYKL
jgi:iron complex outermembrane receptor protein